MQTATAYATSLRSPVVKTTRLQLQCGCYGQRILQYAADGYDCDGVCLNDADGDGVCDEFEIAGCKTKRCNYNADATDSDDSCEYAEDGYDCDGVCLNDADGDGVCDEFEVAEGPILPHATTTLTHRR